MKQSSRIHTFRSVAALATLMLALGVRAAEVSPVMDAKSCEPPKYPKAALMNEETGTVSMGFLIGTDGKVVESKVEKSSGSKSLDKAALTALAQCKFKPGSKDGKPEQMWAKVDFVWKLE
jgi:protein TonB